MTEEKNVATSMPVKSGCKYSTYVLLASVGIPALFFPFMLLNQRSYNPLGEKLWMIQLVLFVVGAITTLCCAISVAFKRKWLMSLACLSGCLINALGTAYTIILGIAMSAGPC